MDASRKRIIAILLIVVIAVAGGVSAWFFLRTYQWSASDAPGAPSDITADQIIRIGVAGDTERIHGEGQLQGAMLAAREINEAGGVQVDGTTYYIGVTAENTDEANPVLDTSRGVAAADRLVNFKNVQFATGGFRTESLLAYRDTFMEASIPFINTGAATTTFCESVLTDYETYKYFWQNNPINSTALAIELITLIVSTSQVQSAIKGFPIDRFSFIRENLAWTAGFAGIMTGALEANGLTFTGTDIAIPQEVSSTEMAAHWNTIDGNNTQIVIPIISGEAGLTFTTSYAENEPACIPIGINVMSQDSKYWELTDGACEYGVTLESVFRTNKTSLTIDMWDAYVEAYDTTPIYTAVGSYDAIYQFAWAIEEAQSFDGDDIVTALETLDRDNAIEGASGRGAFDDSHCIIEGWPYGVALALQWYDGEKQLVPGVGIYPSGFGAIPGTLANISPLQFPDWGIYNPNA
jgi:ABC-type branched-subunit amino acid transport system substrate-binding protein